jgi:hypothetical protein
MLREHRAPTKVLGLVSAIRIEEAYVAQQTWHGIESKSGGEVETFSAMPQWLHSLLVTYWAPHLGFVGAAHLTWVGSQEAGHAS